MFPDMDWLKFLVWSGLITFCTAQWVCSAICIIRIVEWMTGG